jgi:hypothetical protein
MQIKNELLFNLQAGNDEIQNWVWWLGSLSFRYVVESCLVSLLGNCGVQRFVQCQTMDFKASRYDNNETLQASSSQEASDLEGQIIKRSKTKYDY